MPEISDYNSYDIDVLNQILMSGGWRALAELGNYLGFSYRMDRVPWQIMTAFDDVFGDMLVKQDDRFLHARWEVSELLTLAAIPKGKLYSSESGIEYFPYSEYNWGPAEYDAKLQRLLKRVITAFVGSKSLGAALSKINKENWHRFAECWFGSQTEGLIDQLFSVRIDRQWAEPMEWLVHVLRGKMAYEEALWNCVWAFTKPMITKLMEVKKHIVEDIPPTDEQLVYLNSFIKNGYVHGYRIMQRDGRETYRVCLEPGEDRHRYYKPPIPNAPPVFLGPFELREIAHTLLIQPSFCLAQELERKSLKPRFIRQCRAPSCRKRFYTGRKDATACPGSQGDKKNKCALEWIRYKRYLQKIDKDPEKDWNDKQLKKDFISYDKA